MGLSKSCRNPRVALFCWAGGPSNFDVLWTHRWRGSEVESKPGLLSVEPGEAVASQRGLAQLRELSNESSEPWLDSPTESLRTPRVGTHRLVPFQRRSA